MILDLVFALAVSAGNVLPQGLPVPVRGRDPFVFRSVLDGRPRIVTLALSKEMFLAYDAQNCGVYKVWKGGVELKGAVYTTVHGEQPVSWGESYTRGLDGDVWMAEQGGKRIECRARWLGYFFTNKRANLLYEVRLADGRHVTVQESTEFATSESLFNDTQLEELHLVHGTPVWLRTWRTEGLPDGLTIVLRMRTDTAVMQQRVMFPEGCLRNEKIVDAKAGEPGFTYSELPFSTTTPTAYIWTCFEPLPDAAPPGSQAPDGSKPNAAKPNAPGDAKSKSDAGEKPKQRAGEKPSEKPSQEKGG